MIGADPVLRPLWQLLVLTRDPHAPVDLTCEECFALVEYDAGLLEAGVPLDEIRPIASRHLSMCPGCQTKFEEWMGKFMVPAEN
jgi:RNA polymerase subunit RPABC4/transcription elongation factor Spt4